MLVTLQWKVSQDLEEPSSQQDLFVTSTAGHFTLDAVPQGFKAASGGVNIVCDLGDVLISADSRGRKLSREEFYNPRRYRKTHQPTPSPEQLLKQQEARTRRREAQKQRQREAREKDTWLPKDEFVAQCKAKKAKKVFVVLCLIMPLGFVLE